MSPIQSINHSINHWNVLCHKILWGARGPLFQNFVHFLQYAAVALTVCSFCSHTIELVSSIIAVSLLTCVEVLVRAPCRSDEAINDVDL